MPPRDSREKRRAKGGLVLAGTIGGYALAFILGGLAVGFFLDHWLHTTPLFLLAGVLLGFAGCMIQLYRLAMQELDN